MGPIHIQMGPIQIQIQIQMCPTQIQIQMGPIQVQIQTQIGPIQIQIQISPMQQYAAKNCFTELKISKVKYFLLL